MRKLIISTFILICCLASFGQVPKGEASICNAQFARSLVDQLVVNSKDIEETDKRIQVVMRAADFIWPVDQPIARAYFTEAFKVATDRFAEKGIERKEEKGVTLRLPDYRFQVIRAIAKRDPAWARRLTEQILKEYEKGAAERKGFFDRNLEVNEALNVAIQSLKTSPELSWLLFRRVMREPLDFYWSWALSSVASQDPRSGVALYGELLSNYAGETPRRLLFLSLYPFGSEQMIGIDRYSFGISRPDNFVPDPAVQQRFLEFFFRQSIAYASNPDNLNRPPDEYRHSEPVYILSAANELEPIVLRDFPTLLPLISEARAKAAGMLSNEARNKWSESERFIKDVEMPFEQRLKELEDAEFEARLTDTMILRALLTIKTDEHFKQFERWLDKVKEEKARTDMTSHFFIMRADLAIKEARYDDAQRWISKVPETEYKAVLMLRVVDKQIAASDNFSAAKWLSDVGDLADKTENPVTKARVIFGISLLFEKIDHLSAINRLYDAVRVTNKVQTGDLLNPSLTRSIKTKDFSHFVGYQSTTFDLETTFTTLSKSDFSNPYSNAQALDNKYYRSLAVFAVAKNCMDKQTASPQKPKFVTGNY